jgi:hypothetical protein
MNAMPWKHELKIFEDNLSTTDYVKSRQGIAAILNIVHDIVCSHCAVQSQSRFSVLKVPLLELENNTQCHFYFFHR